MILGITGATGFVGRALLDRALTAGHSVRALARRPQTARAGVTWIAGDLAAPGDLAVGTDAVIHVAGVVNAPDRAGFDAGNVAGTARILTAAGAAGVRRFVHVSSLSAREPALSNYGGSKAAAERLVAASGLEWTIVRPPAIYGPGDLDQRDLYRLAARSGLALLPPRGRLSLLAVDDLARLLLSLAQADGPQALLEADDGTPGGWTHEDYARAIGDAVGRRVWPIHLPRAVLALGARVDRIARGAAARLTADRVAYFCHPDWTIDPARRPSPDLWTPAVDTREGLAATARWYRAHGLL